jgi:D-ribose pyranase
VDLAFLFGVSSFETVLSDILEELVVEGATAAEETKIQNPRSHELLESRLPDL